MAVKELDYNHEGQVHKISYEYDGTKYPVEFGGLTFEGWWMFDQDFLSTNNIDSLYKMIDFIVEHRGEQTREFVLFEDFSLIAHGCVTPHELAHDSPVNLKQWAHPNDLTFGLVFNSSQGSEGNILVDRREDPIWCCNNLHSGQKGKPEFRFKHSGFRKSKTKWNKIWNYTFKMNSEEFGFFRDTRYTDHKERPGVLYFGLELEVSSNVSSEELQEIVTEVEPKQESFFIFKSDSSITNSHRFCYELVTVPCTPKYLRTQFKILFEKLEKLCKVKSLELKDVFNCTKKTNNGLHIHVSKESLESKAHMRRFQTIFHESNKAQVDFFQAISGRQNLYTKHGYCHIHSEIYKYRLPHKIKADFLDRVSICHNVSGHTIEVRLFQGIFNIKHIFRCVSFTEAMVEYTSRIGYTDIGPKFIVGFKEYVSKHKKFKSVKEVFDQCV